jgi:hypothetical protein
MSASPWLCFSPQTKGFSRRPWEPGRMADFLLASSGFILAMQLQSFSRLFLVLSVVPMGLIGVVAALLLFNKPLGLSPSSAYWRCSE